MSAPDPGTTRWRCVCAYDGTPFSGWQSQTGENGPGDAELPAIQDVVEARMTEIFKTRIRTHASGRTDAGVHAHRQVFHFDAAWRHGAAKLLAAMRANLTPALQIKSVRVAAPDFHARFQATGKRYDYYVHLGDADPFKRPYCWPVFRPLDVGAMRAAAATLEGHHDFRAFTALNGPEREDTTRELRRLAIRQRGRVLQITAEAPGFLYKMVRSLAGALVSVGEGRLTVDQIRRSLACRERIAAIQTAPAKGLFLTRVYY
jgi:tRNA pseudouridine38-40 synthase